MSIKKCGYKIGNGCRMKNKLFPLHNCDGLNNCRYKKPTTIAKVQKASKIGSIQCAPKQCELCATAANEHLITGLKEIVVKLEHANEHGVIRDTLWYSPYETLFDFINSLINEEGDTNHDL